MTSERRWQATVEPLAAFPEDRIIWRPELRKLCGDVSSETIRTWMKSGRLPQPDKRLSTKTMGWAVSTLRRAGILPQIGAEETDDRRRASEKLDATLIVNYTFNMESKLTGQGGPGRGQGRKPLRDVRMVQTSLKLTPWQRAKLARLGGSEWVRERIDRAHEPKE